MFSDVEQRVKPCSRVCLATNQYLYIILDQLELQIKNSANYDRSKMIYLDSNIQLSSKHANGFSIIALKDRNEEKAEGLITVQL